jgi:hypothetical protein
MNITKTPTVECEYLKLFDKLWATHFTLCLGMASKCGDGYQLPNIIILLCDLVCALVHRLGWVVPLVLWWSGLVFYVKRKNSFINDF